MSGCDCGHDRVLTTPKVSNHLQPPTLYLQDAALVVATNRDPTNYPYGGKPSNDTTMYCTTHTGGMQV